LTSPSGVRPGLIETAFIEFLPDLVSKVADFLSMFCFGMKPEVIACDFSR